MDRPLPANTFNEARYYLEVTACSACGSGPMTPTSNPRPNAGDVVDVRAVCGHCGGTETFAFRCEHALPETGHEAEIINPTDRASEIVDLSNWLSLFYSLIHAGAQADNATITRRIGYQASLCLSEALKFYPPGSDTPPDEAFFTDESRQAYARSPETFTRTRLLSMRARLPNEDRMVRRIEEDRTEARKRKWWQFWKRTP